MRLKLPAFANDVTEERYCHVRPLQAGTSGLRVACAGAERCLAEYRVARDGFACFGMEFVAEGEGTLTLAGAAHALRPGTAFLYGPGVAHRITTDPRRRMRKYFVDFFGQEAPGLLKRLQLEAGSVHCLREINIVATLFDDLIHHGQRGTRPGADVADAYLKVLLHKVAELTSSPPAQRSAAYRTWRRCEEIVEADFRQLRGLHELSLRTKVHPSHLCRLYKQFGNRSPHAEITRRKMNHAAMLLMTSPARVQAVALEVGYEDPLHFSRLFRKHFGRSPLEFRRSERRATRPQSAQPRS